jgi:dCTP deaminase
MPLSDKQIKLREGMITPFVDHQVSEGGAISYGLSSYGYDIRVANEFRVCAGVPWKCVDPKRFPDASFVSLNSAGYCIIPPNSFALARSLEWVEVPRDIMVICLGKSTYARCGIVVNVTPLEPEWKGYITIEISNTTPLPAKVYAGEGIAQLVFLSADEICDVSYADRKGRYQHQKGIVLPFTGG